MRSAVHSVGVDPIAEWLRETWAWSGEDVLAADQRTKASRLRFERLSASGWPMREIALAAGSQMTTTGRIGPCRA
jgi:hypothetical protein